MVEVYCQRCGGVTDRLYVISEHREPDEYWCADCVLESLETPFLSKWNEKDFEMTGVRRKGEGETERRRCDTCEYFDDFNMFCTHPDIWNDLSEERIKTGCKRHSKVSGGQEQ